MHKRFQLENMAALVEFLVGAGLGIFFHWVLNYREAAFIIFGIGMLMSLMTYLLREELAKVRESLVEHYRQSHEITFAVSRINDPECLAKASEVLSGAKKTIETLQQGYIPLSETEFWLESARAADQATTLIRAVDPLSSGWDTRGAMVNFYQANLRALERGAKIIRIFITGRDEFQEPEAQRIIAGQLKDGIDVRVAYREELPSTGDVSWSGSGAQNFALYDDHLVSEVTGSTNPHFGRKTTQAVEVAKYRRILDVIEHNAYRISPEGEGIVVSCSLPVPV